MIFEYKKTDAYRDAYGRHRGTRQNSMFSRSISLLWLQWKKKKKIKLAFFSARHLLWTFHFLYDRAKHGT